MALESVTDETIAALLAQPKTVSNPGARETDKGSHKQTNYVVRGAAGDAFTLYLRQNNRIADDFSCGLCWHAPSGETLTLVRYNGAGHAHRNPGAREWLPRTCHIHRAMRACLDADRKPEAFAAATDRYVTLAGALHELVADCKIDGIQTRPEQPKLL